MKRSAARMLAFVVALTTLAAPAEAGTDEALGTIPTVRVRIVDNRFRPISLTIERGTRVRWRNRGDNPHTTTSDTGIWDSGTLSTGEPFRRRFRRRGTFDYHCEIHPSMTATIIVT